VIACALVPDWIAPYPPDAFDYDALLQPPSAAHAFGTDNFGRDILSRTIWAARVDLQIAIFGTLFPAVFGTFAGALIGYAGGLADTLFRRLVDLLITIPFLVLVIAIVAALGPGLLNMYIAVSAVAWVFYARLMRAEIIAQKRRDYADAGRVMGYTPRIIFRHLLPTPSPSITFWMTTGAGDPARVERLSRPWRAAPDSGMGCSDRRRQGFMTTAPVDSIFPAWPSFLPAWASDLSATALQSDCGGGYEAPVLSVAISPCVSATSCPCWGSASTSTPARYSASWANPARARA
jgi:peptide/nickel transport system permease protein